MSASERIPFEGVLNCWTGEHDLPDLLLAVSRSGKTGRLLFSNAEADKTLYVKEGKIVFAESSSDDDGLGQYLLRIGKISLQDFTQVSQLVEPGKRLGALLVAEGVLGPKELVPAVVGQVRSIILGLFRRTETWYGFKEEELSRRESITLDMPVAQLLLDGVQSVESWRRISRGVGDLDSVYRAVESFEEEWQRLELAEDVEELLSLLKEPVSVADICTRARMPDFNACRYLWIFRALGWVESAEADAVVEVEEPAYSSDEADAEPDVDRIAEIAAIAATEEDFPSMPPTGTPAREREPVAAARPDSELDRARRRLAISGRCPHADGARQASRSPESRSDPGDCLDQSAGGSEAKSASTPAGGARADANGDLLAVAPPSQTGGGGPVAEPGQDDPIGRRSETHSQRSPPYPDVRRAFFARGASEGADPESESQSQSATPSTGETGEMMEAILDDGGERYEGFDAGSEPTPPTGSNASTSTQFFAGASALELPPSPASSVEEKIAVDSYEDLFPSDLSSSFASLSLDYAVESATTAPTTMPSVAPPGPPTPKGIETRVAFDPPVFPETPAPIGAAPDSNSGDEGIGSFQDLALSESAISFATDPEPPSPATEPAPAVVAVETHEAMPVVEGDLVTPEPTPPAPSGMELFAMGDPFGNPAPSTDPPPVIEADDPFAPTVAASLPRRKRTEDADLDTEGLGELLRRNER